MRIYGFMGQWYTHKQFLGMKKIKWIFHDTILKWRQYKKFVMRTIEIEDYLPASLIQNMHPFNLVYTICCQNVNSLSLCAYPSGIV